MSRKEPDNFYRRQQEEANRIATKQHRVLTDIAKLTKSSNEELRKLRKAFEAFAEAVLDMKIEPFQGAVLSEAARGQVAEFDAKGFKEALGRGEAPTVPEGKPYPKVDFTPKPGDEKRVEYVERERRRVTGLPDTPPEGPIDPDTDEPSPDKEEVEKPAGRRLGYGDVIATDDAPISGSVAEEAAFDAVLGDQIASGEHPPPLFEVQFDAEGYIVPGTLPLEPSEDVPVTMGGKEIGRANVHADGTADIEFLYPSTPEEQAEAERAEAERAEEECADVSEARRIPQGYATGGYTGTDPHQHAGIVHQAESYGLPFNESPLRISPVEAYIRHDMEGDPVHHDAIQQAAAMRRRQQGLA